MWDQLDELDAKTNQLLNKVHEKEKQAFENKDDKEALSKIIKERDELAGQLDTAMAESKKILGQLLKDFDEEEPKP
jgi:shikimate kinase